MLLQFAEIFDSSELLIMRLELYQINTVQIAWISNQQMYKAHNRAVNRGSKLSSGRAQVSLFHDLTCLSVVLEGKQNTQRWH